MNFLGQLEQFLQEHHGPFTTKHLPSFSENKHELFKVKDLFLAAGIASCRQFNNEGVWAIMNRVRADVPYDINHPRSNMLQLIEGIPEYVKACTENGNLFSIDFTEEHLQHRHFLVHMDETEQRHNQLDSEEEWEMIRSTLKQQWNPELTLEQFTKNVNQVLGHHSLWIKEKGIIVV